jgi:Xaa-Pro dipeptidase
MEQNHHSLYPSHVEEVQRRWETALTREDFSAALVHSGTPMYSFLDDYEYAFRPNPHFLSWLPLTRHPDSALLIVPGSRPTLFFYQPVDYWYLPPSDPEAYWADLYDLEIVRDPSDWSKRLPGVLSGAGLSLDEVAVIGDSPALKDVFSSAQINPQSLVDRIHISRTRKTPYEVACVQASARLAARAHAEAERAFREGEPEFAIHMRYLEACGHSDASLPYNNIVALNEHGSVLHYQGRAKQPPAQSRSFLTDAGCTVNAYASDITRTYAREPGVFADLVTEMDALQQGLTAQVRAGLDYKELHLEAHRKIAGLLESFGVINVSAGEAVETGLSGVFYPHGLGHFLGLQTHDVAGLIDNDARPIPRPDGHPFLRLTRVLEAGNVLTIEPGLYFIEPLLRGWRESQDPAVINWDRVEELAPYGGIRIEDNVHVTETGCDNLTRTAFAEL